MQSKIINKIRELRKQGLTYREIAERVGFSKKTIDYHCRDIKKPAKEPKRFSTIRCEYCEKISELDFEPDKSWQKLKVWRCPFCHKIRKVELWKQKNTIENTEKRTERS